MLSTASPNLQPPEALLSHVRSVRTRACARATHEESSRHDQRSLTTFTHFFAHTNPENEEMLKVRVEDDADPLSLSHSYEPKPPETGNISRRGSSSSLGAADLLPPAMTATSATDEALPTMNDKSPTVSMVKSALDTVASVSAVSIEKGPLLLRGERLALDFSVHFESYGGVSIEGKLIMTNFRLHFFPTPGSTESLSESELSSACLHLSPIYYELPLSSVDRIEKRKVSEGRLSLTISAKDCRTMRLILPVNRCTNSCFYNYHIIIITMLSKHCCSGWRCF